MKLILFDVDQTLVDALPHHEVAYERMFGEVFGVNAKLTDIEFWGKITPNIIEEIAGLKGIPKKEVKRKLADAVRKLEAFFQESAAEGKVKVLPGVRELLANLKKRGHRLGVLTGNTEGITQGILRGSGLEGYFDLFVYGSGAKDRAELVGKAMAEAKYRFGREFLAKDLVIVGDSTHDIECGKPHDAMTIAVATGFHSKEELMKHKPDHLFEDLTDPNILKVFG
ncbi:MAG: HAD family hydrolase [Candidatus Hodarchaeaceae archaeon]|nr:HAD family hydrolase [Candidatus Hodarchaeaceae archaeon]